MKIVIDIKRRAKCSRVERQSGCARKTETPLVKCNAYAVVTGDEFVIKGFHLHGTVKQEAKAIEKSVIRTAAENTAISSRSALGDITNMMVASPSTSENFMTSKETIGRQIRRERAKSQSRPVVPKDYDDLLSIPMKFQSTADNQLIRQDFTRSL